MEYSNFCPFNHHMSWCRSVLVHFLGDLSFYTCGCNFFKDIFDSFLSFFLLLQEFLLCIYWHVFYYPTGALYSFFFLSLHSLCCIHWVSLILVWGRSSGRGHGNPLQYSGMENPMDRRARRATVHEVTKKSDMTQQGNNNNNS